MTVHGAGMCLALGAAGLPTAALAADGTPQAPMAGPDARKAYALSAGPLELVLARFAAQAGLALSFDPTLAAGIRSDGLQGRFGGEEGLRALLQGSGLTLQRKGDGRYTLLKQPKASERVSSPSPGGVLRSVIVRAAADRETATGPVAGYIARRSASATKSDIALIETPRSVSVITEEQMRDRKVLSVEDAVAYTAGVQIATAGDDPRFDQIKVRGFDLTTDADYRDGLRQPNTGWLSYFHTEPYALERLEVVKGPDSVTYGQISPGGLVNRVSKRPTREPIREVEVQAGIHGHRQAQFDLGAELAPGSDWQYRLVGLTRKANTGTVGVNDDSTYLAPSLTWAPSARTQVTLLAHWNQYETSGSPRPFQLPDGTLTEFWSGDIGFDGLKQRQWTLGYEARHQLSEQLTVRQNLRYAQVNTDNQYLSGKLDTDAVTIRRTAYGVYEKMRAFAVDSALEARFATGALRHTVVAGVDYAEVSADVSYQSGSAPSIDMLSPDHRQTVARPDTVLVAQAVDGMQTGLYLSDRMSIGSLRLSAGLRRDSVRQKKTNLAASTSVRQVDRATTGSLGALYLINDAWAPYISLANSFVPQFGSNLAGNAFEPTKGRQVEMGLKYQPLDGQVSHTVSVFDLVQQNVKTRDPANPANTLQTGELRSRGVELESHLSLDNGLRFTASYTYNDVKVTRSNNGNEGKRPVTTPRQLASAWVHKRFGAGLLEGIDAGLGARWSGTSFSDTANTQRNPGYTLLDAGIGYKLRSVLPGARLGLNISNLSDKRFISCQNRHCYRGRGRSIVASLNYRW